MARARRSMLKDPVSIRTALAEDAAVVARLAEATFRDAFASYNTTSDMDAHCSRHFGEVQQRAEILDPAMTTVLVEAGSAAVAFGQLRVGPAPPCVMGANAIEIQRFYVDRRWHGLGVAQQLMARLVTLAGDRGAESVWLGVWASNPRAIAFYRKAGFQPVGEKVFVVGADRQRDLVLQRPITGR